jgi:hypothetical protein
MADWRSVRDEVLVDETEFDTNSHFLENLGSLEFTSNMTIAITDRGYAQVGDWRKRTSFAERLSTLQEKEQITFQKRGRELEKLLADVAEYCGWRVDLNTRRPGEEVDIIISRNMKYFIVSAKWERKPIQPKAMRDLRERVTHRHGSVGIFVSMSGFTDEAASYAIERLESAAILLFGPEDVAASLRGELTNIIESKLHQMMTIRAATFS